MIHRQLARLRRCSLHARSPASIKLHSSAAPRHQDGGLLTRDFIAKSLYNQDTGYFSTKDVINDLPGPLEFGSMMGELHYRLDVKKVRNPVPVHVCVSSNGNNVCPRSRILGTDHHVMLDTFFLQQGDWSSSTHTPSRGRVFHTCGCAYVAQFVRHQHGARRTATTHSPYMYGGFQTGWPNSNSDDRPCCDTMFVGVRVQAVGVDDSSGNLLSSLLPRASEVYRQRGEEVLVGRKRASSKGIYPRAQTGSGWGRRQQQQLQRRRGRRRPQRWGRPLGVI